MKRRVLLLALAGVTMMSFGAYAQDGGADPDTTMYPRIDKLDEVVVTAFGISREKKTVGYAVQEVGGGEVTKAKADNFMASLSGKVAGVNVTQSGTMGGSANVVIRGYKSLTGNNQALFVVDGIPISNQIANTSNQNTGRGGYDYGNAAMDINPEDIESVSVLKGAAATALYGSRAANGVILITTKKGAKRKGLGVTVNYGMRQGTIDPTTFVNYQKEFGAGYGPYYGPDTINGYYTAARAQAYDVNGDGVDDIAIPMGEDASFGLAFDPNLDVYTWESIFPELDSYGQSFKHAAPDTDASDFYQASSTVNKSVAIDGGSDVSAFRLSATQFETNGIVPGSSLQRNNITFNGSLQASDRLKVSATANYIQQNARGRFGTGYDSRNINQAFRQWWNVGVDVNKLEQYYYENPGTNITWNPYGYGAANPTKPHYFDNPYWSTMENYSSDSRDRIIGSVTAEYKINDWLNFMARGTMDSYSDIQEERIAVYSTDVANYTRRNRQFSETNVDFILSGTKWFGADNEFSFSGNLGSNFRRTAYDYIGASTNGGLVVPGVYALSNSASTPNAPSESRYEIGVNGFFGRASLGYKNFLFAEFTGRQDVSSTLPVENNTFFYPSATLSLVFSELVDLPGMSYGKLRANVAEVGASAPAQALADAYIMGTAFGSQALASAPSTSNNAGLRPEMTNSTEFGLEMMFLENRYGFDISLYDQTSSDQIMPTKVSSASGTIYKYVNAGVINNRGIEISLNASPIRTENFGWDINLNWTKNENRVMELYEGLENLQLASVQGGITIEARAPETDADGNTTYYSFGTIYGVAGVYDDAGRRVVYDHPRGGVRYLRGDKEVIGDINPDWMAGLNNSFRFGRFTASALLDMRMGGNFFSLDTYYGMGTGIYDVTAGQNDLGNSVRDVVVGNPVDGYDASSGGVRIDNVTYMDANGDYHEGVSAYGNMWYYANYMGWATAPKDLHVYDASYLKLREVSLSYAIPAEWISQYGLKGASVALQGRNLAILWKNAPYTDPEAGLSAGNIQGYQSGAYPAVREVGFNVKLNF